MFSDLEKTSEGFRIPGSLFSKELHDFLINDGFELGNNDSYAEERVTNHSSSCYKKMVGYSNGDWPVTVYVCDDGIEIDVDYECGGNSHTSFIRYNAIDEEGFKEAWKEMLENISGIVYA